MENKQQNQNSSNNSNENSVESVGNQQHTTQTGGQNNRGQDVNAERDEFTDDLQQSGNRNSSNQKDKESSRH